MKIRYVVSSMLFWWRENNLSFEQDCNFLRSQGFGIELWPTLKGLDECRYDRRNWSRLASATEGMLVSMRSCQSCNGGLSMDEWLKQIDCAVMLGANIITDLCSLGIPPGENTNGSTKTADVMAAAKDKGITICVETGPLEDVLRAGDKFESLHYCLDTGFAHLDKEHSFTEYVDRLADRVFHLHLTDNYGQIDDHEPPGLRGGISRDHWQYLLDALTACGNEVIGSLEMYPCMPGVMLRQATEFLFDDLDWPNRPQKHPDEMLLSYNPE